MILSVSLVALLLAVVVTYWWRRSRSSTAVTGVPAVNLDGSGRFHAVSIRFGPGSCEQSRQLHGNRYLAGSAPDLPLPGCDVADCQCRFVHHGDRRQGGDRRSPYQGGFGGSAPRQQDDRRSRPDRRSELPDE